MLLMGLGQRGEAPLESDLRKGKCIEGLGCGWWDISISSKLVGFSEISPPQSPSQL